MTIPALAALGLGAATLIGGLAWWRLVGAPQPTPSTVAASGPRTLPPPSADTALTSTVTPAAPPAETPAETPAALARPAYTPVRVLDELVALADPSIAVQASADRAQVVIGRDRLQFRVRANVAGHVYVYLVGTEGRRVELLFPNTIDADNRIGRDQELTLPRPAWRITAGGPPGIDHLAVVVSPQPRDIAATGAKAAAGEMLQSFDDALAQSLWRAGDGKRSGFLGEADCRSAAAPCPTGHGATVVRIEEVAAR